MSVHEPLEEGQSFGGYFTPEAKAERRRAYRRNHKTDYRREFRQVPVRNGTPFCIVPEVGPILRELAEKAGREASVHEASNYGINDESALGINILGARAALVMGKTEGAVVRRLYAVIHQRQLWISATFVEACLMAMDAERDYVYGEWPSCRADALERVSLEAEYAGKKLSPSKLLARANRLFDKGVRKSLRRAAEVTV